VYIFVLWYTCFNRFYLPIIIFLFPKNFTNSRLDDPNIILSDVWKAVKHLSNINISRRQ